MTSLKNYEVTLELSTPSTVTVEQIINFKYKVTNRLQVPIPGGEIPLMMNWANLGPVPLVPHVLIFGSLGPGESITEEYEEKSLVDGMIMVSSLDKVCRAKDGKNILVYLPDGRRTHGGQLIHAIRVKSKEEVSQNWANWIAAIAFILLIIIQLIDWWFQGFIGTK